MSQKEVLRLEILQKVDEKRLSQGQAAETLNINPRHVRRLLAQYRKDGAAGLISRRRGKPSNRKLSDNLKEVAIALIKEHYHDFGPTFANEKLREIHQLLVSTATLRKWMIEAQIWVPRAQRPPKVHQPRYRRACFGELIQIDGSEHDWFEGRGPKCTLLVYVDDATSKILQMRFVPAESTFTYFEATNSYIRQYGKPIAFYSDKYSVFRVNCKNAKGGDKITQFGRALMELNIDIINAHTSQAKGRVERTNKTLQDRLIKEMRLKGISSMANGNAYLPTFIEDYNRRFGRCPFNEADVHRPLQDWENESLDDIFCWQEDRTLSNNLTLQYDKRMYLVEDSVETRKLRRKRVTVYDYNNGTIKIVHGKQVLPYRVFDKLQRVDEQAIVDNKRLGSVLSYVKQKQELRNEERSKSCPKRYPLEYLAS